MQVIRSNFLAVFFFLILLFVILPSNNSVYATSLRFYGTGTNQVDRVEIPLDNPEKPVDVGATDFTIEFWMKSPTNANTFGYCDQQNDGWITGHVIIDRDIYNAGDYGDFGIAITSLGEICFGATRANAGDTIVSSGINVRDGNWHHVAISRAFTDGISRIYIDGTLRASGTTASGNISYRNGRTSGFVNDPYLVFGAEKHDAGSTYPSFNGFLDDVRISRVVRYNTNFIRPASAPVSDTNTVGLYTFESTAGNCTGTVQETSGYSGGPSNGICLFGGGTNKGPVYVSDSPYTTSPTTAPTAIPATPTRTPTPTTAPVSTLTPSPTRVPPTATPSVIPTSGPSPTSTPCPNKKYGDADCNNLINEDDFTIWKNEYLSQGSTLRANFNFTVDQKVNLIDLEIWVRGKLFGIPNTSVTPVPQFTIVNTPSITPAQTMTSIAPTVPIGSAQYPAQVLNLTNWKETLPVKDPDESGPWEIKQNETPPLATFRLDPWFVVNPAGGVRFRAPVTGVTTGGSSYSRSELREMINNGKDNADWSSGSGVHTMYIDQAITAKPQVKDEVVAGQIHDGGDDVIVIRLDGTNLYINPADEGDDGLATKKTLNANYRLGERFQIKFEVSGNQTRVYYNNSATPAMIYKKAYSGAYFKAGAYTQSNCNSVVKIKLPNGEEEERKEICSQDNYGEVIIYDVRVTHQ